MARNDDEPWRPAVETGDVELLRQVIQQYGKEVLEVAPWICATPLHIAVRRSHVAMVQFLVEECSSAAWLKWQDGSSEGKQHDALQIAADSKNLALVQYLVEKGFDVEDRHLSVGMASGDQAIVNFMMEARLVQEVKRSHQNTLNEVESLLKECEQLVDKCKRIATRHDGADARLEQFRQGPLFTACQTGPLTMVQYLVETRRLSVESRDGYKQTPVFKACASGRLEIVRYLVEKCHVSVECLDVEQRTPLFLACERGQLEIVEYLVETCHANLEVRNQYGCGPLYYAMTKGHFEVVRYLVEKCGVDCDSTFHGACDKQRLDMVRYFLQHGNVSVDWTNKNGETAFHRACSRADWDVVQLLVVDGNANVSATSNNGWNGLHTLCRYAKSCTATKSVEIVQYLLRTGRINVNAQDCRGQTALHHYFASCCDDLQIPRLLLQCYGPARVDLPDADGATCLHYAAKQGRRSFRSLRMLHLLVVHLSADFGTDHVSAFDYTFEAPKDTGVR